MILGLASLLMTLLIRVEHWSLILSSVLFLVGAIPLTTAIAILIGEGLGWAIYWYYWGQRCSRVSGRLFLEKFIITLLASFVMIFLLLIMKGAGWLHIGISGTVEERKFYFVMGWILWEVMISVVWAIWGHFRSRSNIIENSDLTPISIPIGLLGAKWWGYKGWLPLQIQNRVKGIRKRKEKLEMQLNSLTEEEKLRFPPGFLSKTHQEVESLKRLLGALPSDSV